MTSTFKRLGQSELLPRYIFAESLVARRRVLEIGAVASTLGQSARFLSTRGARMVVAADNDLVAVQEAQARLASPTLRFRPTVFDDFESGSFDLVIVSDLAPYVRAPELMADIARLVAKSGYLMGGLRNPAGLSLSSILEADETDVPPTYGQLLDVLSTHFESVDVATQSPVLGYQLAFERGEGLQVDGSLAGSSEAAYYVVLAGHEEVRNFDPTWVQLPPEPLAFTGGKLEDASNRARDWRERTEKLKELLERKTAELQVRDGQLHENSQQLEAAKEAVSRLTAQLESTRDRPEAVRDREDLAMRIRQMEAELQVSRERAIDAEGRVSASRSALEVLERQHKDAAIQALAAQESARLERARREELGSQLEDGRLRLAKAYEDLRRLHDEAASERVEHERGKIAFDRLKENLERSEKELHEARGREVRLADARTEAIKAIENLEATTRETRRALDEAKNQLDRKESERLSSLRSLDVETQLRHQLEKELESEKARQVELLATLAQRTSEHTAAETEIAALKSNLEHSAAELVESRAGEARWNNTATEREQRIAELHGREAELERTVQLGTLRVNELHAELEQQRVLVGQKASAVESLDGALASAESKLKALNEKYEVERQKLRGALDEALAQHELSARERDLRLSENESLREAVAQEQDKSRKLSEALSTVEATSATLNHERDLGLNEIQKLREELSSEQSKSNSLGGALSAAESTVSTLTHERDLRLNEIQKLREAFGAEQDKVNGLNATLSNAESAASLLGHERDLGLHEIQKLRNAFSVEQGKVNELRGALSTAESTVSALTHERDLGLNESQRLKEALTAEEGKSSQLSAALSTAESTLSALSQERDVGLNDAQKFKEALTAAEEKSAQLSAALSNAESTLSALSYERDAGLSETQKFKEALTTEEEKSTQLRAALSNAESKLSALLQERDVGLNETQKFKEALTAEEEKSRQLSAALSNSASTLKALTYEKDIGLSEAQKFKEALTAEEETSKQLSAALSAATHEREFGLNEIEKFKGLLATEESKLTQLGIALSSAELTVGLLTDERDRSTADNQNLRAAWEAEAAKVAVAVTQLETLNSDRDELRRSLEKAEQFGLEQSGEVARLTEQAAASASRLTDTERERERNAQESRNHAENLSRELVFEREGRSSAEAALNEAQRALAREAEEKSERERTSRAQLDEVSANLGATQSARDELERSLSVAREENQSARAQLEAKTSALADAVYRRELIDLERVELERRYRKLEGDAQLVGDRASHLETQIRDLKGSLREAEEQFESEKLQLNEVRQELTEQFGKTRAREARVEELNVELRKTKQVEADTRGLQSIALTELNETREQLRSMEARAENSERSHEQSKARLSDLEEMLQERELGLEGTGKKLLQLQEERSLLSQSLATSMGQLEHTRLELEEALHTRAQERALLENTDTKLAALSATHIQLDEQFDSLKRERAELAQSVATLQEKVTQLEAHLHASEEKAAKFERQRELVQSALEVQSANADEAQRAVEEKLDASQRQYQEVRQTVDRAQSEARGHQAGKLVLNQEIETLRSEAAALRARFPQLDSALAEARARIATFMGAEREYKQQVLNLDLALAKAKAEVAELEDSQVMSEAARVALESEVRSLREKSFSFKTPVPGELDPEETQSGFMHADLVADRMTMNAELSAAQMARLQAEELLLALRLKYGELQRELDHTTQDLAEAKAEHELLEHDRERLAHEVASGEKVRARAVQLERELDRYRAASRSAQEKPVEVLDLDVDSVDDAEEIILLDDEQT